MALHDFEVTLGYLREAIDALDHARDGELSRVERIALWLDVRDELRALQVVVHQMAGESAVAVAEENARLGAKPREDYWLPDGRAVHLRPGSVRYRWRGEDLLRRLAEEMVTSDGEIIDALPLGYAFRFLSACQPEVSGGWRSTGLSAVVEDWQKYREREEDADVIEAGAKSEWGR